MPEHVDAKSVDKATLQCMRSYRTTNRPSVVSHSDAE